jgi:hypothetical protein
VIACNGFVFSVGHLLFTVLLSHHETGDDRPSSLAQVLVHQRRRVLHVLVSARLDVMCALMLCAAINVTACARSQNILMTFLSKQNVIKASLTYTQEEISNGYQVSIPVSANCMTGSLSALALESNADDVCFMKLKAVLGMHSGFTPCTQAAGL